ncbi:MAG TPA: ATPase domain-containing protein [Longimicrobiales bacterium]
MTETDGKSVRGLASGVPGLDQVLGGGIPEYSFNLIAGEPGTGKTTLAQQILFANATPARPALYFTVLGEPTLKMLRYQQQFSFFDVKAVGTAIRFVNLSDLALQQDLEQVLERIVQEVEEAQPSLVVVDSFRTVLRTAATGADAEPSLQSFLQRLAIQLTNRQVTSFLVGEYSEAEVHNNPIFTVADGILWMFQKAEGNASVRKLQAIKMRGRATIPGLHPFRISPDGIRVFPRIGEVPVRPDTRRSSERLSTGIPALDEMMGGGIPAGDAVLVAGPAGSGKTLVGMQFMIDGLRRGEAGVIAMFEEYPEEYLLRASMLGVDLEAMMAEGRLRLMRLRPLDLSVDEVLQELQDSVARLGATRVVIDSLSGFEVGLAMTEGGEMRQSLYRMIATLTGLGITVVMTAEVADAFAPPRFTAHAISFLTDDIVMQRFVELNGYIRSVIGVVKMRRSSHSRALRLYQITPSGLIVDEVLRGYDGIVTGVPVQRGAVASPSFEGLTGRESVVLQALMELRDASLEAIQGQTGLSEVELRHALANLVARGFVADTSTPGEQSYRYQTQPRDARAEQ